MRLIDADELKKQMCKSCNTHYPDEPCEPSDCVFYRSIEESNTIDNIYITKLDDVSIIKCKDCKYRTWFAPYYGCGNFESPFYASVDSDIPIMTKPDDFCSYGELKD